MLNRLIESTGIAPERCKRLTIFGLPLWTAGGSIAGSIRKPTAMNGMNDWGRK